MSVNKKIGSTKIQTDIVIIGAGGAGLAAAIAATDEGAKVVLLEKLNAPGGNTARAQAFFAAESPVQKRLRIDASRDVLFRMAMDYAHWKINPRIMRAFIDKSGDTVRVHVKLIEGNRQRTQVFEGTVIRIHKGKLKTTFTVRKISYGVGVERIFPLHSQIIEKIEVVRRGRVRRSRLYYLRGRYGKKGRIKELRTS